MAETATLSPGHRGVFSDSGTRLRPTSDSFQAGGKVFFPSPSGPYEEGRTSEPQAAQQHYFGREIKLRNPSGLQLPQTSYRQHYPPKDVPGDPAKPPNVLSVGARFAAISEYGSEFPAKTSEPFHNKVVDAEAGPPRYVAPAIDWQTTHRHFHTPFTVPSTGTTVADIHPVAAADMAPFLADTFSTTYMQHFVPKETAPRSRSTPANARPQCPMLSKSTTYGSEYLPKDVSASELPYPDLGQEGAPFDPSTTYGREFSHKEGYPEVPHLTGISSNDGIQLPFPRRSLGVQYVTPDSSDRLFVLIPRHVEAPCTARQLFTTVNDNQEQTSILVLYGDSPVASENTLLGQFDITNIPPAPKDVPRIEVTFHIDRDMVLTAHARDLDTMRQKLWKQRGEIIVPK